MRGIPRSYGSYADFVREVVKPLHRIGFCVADLEAEASFQAGFEDVDDRDPEELDFRR